MLLKAFLDYLLLEKKYSQLTVNAYKKDIETFFNFIKDTRESLVDSMTVETDSTISHLSNCI